MGGAEVTEIAGGAVCISTDFAQGQRGVFWWRPDHPGNGNGLAAMSCEPSLNPQGPKHGHGDTLLHHLAEIIHQLRLPIATPTTSEQEHSMPADIDGPSRLFHIEARTIEGKQEEEACHVLILRDITRQKSLEVENQVLLQQTEILQKIARIDVLEVCAETGVIELPESFRDVLRSATQKNGLTLSEFIDLIHPDDKPDLIENVKNCMATNKAIDVEFRVEIPSKDVRWIRCHSLPSMEDARGRLPRRWSVQDVTFYKMVNRELLEKLRASNQHLMLANSSLNDFSYALSHDIKRPLRHVSSFAELLGEALERGDMAAARDFSRRISEGAAEMSELIAAMHKFARLGQHAMKFESLDHQRMLAELVEQLASGSTHPAIRVDMAADMPRPFVDASLWQILWVNLIENAIKYSSEREEINLYFGFEIGPHEVSYSIRDNGVGFEPGQAAGLFQMFRRLANDGRFDGTGIGLAYARRIVEAHGGTISAVAAPECGATFTVTLPLPVQ